jgi:HlyD family secretion protein
MNPGVFRKVSLERLSSPERLDLAWKVTSPKEWMALLGIFFLIGAATVWGFKGSLSSKVMAQGLIIHRGGVVNIVAPGTGQVVRVNVRVGDNVHANDVIAEIAQPGQMERIKVTQGALDDAKRERERQMRVKTDGANLQLEALARQRANAEREIVELGDQIKIVNEQIPVDEELLSRGLITKQQSLATRQKKVTLEGEVANRQAQIKQYDAQKFSTEDQPRESDIDMQARITDLERNLAALEQDLATTSKVVSPYTGRVLELKVYRGSAVSDGTPMVSIQPDAGNLEALVYLSAVEAKDVEPGMPAQISPGTVRREEYGFMTGKVAFVADYPATPVAMMSVLGNDPLVQSINAAGPVTEVRIDLDPAPTASGFKWSSRAGPPSKISSGTLCSVQVVTSHDAPITLVVPMIKEKLGLN